MGVFGCCCPFLNSSIAGKTLFDNCRGGEDGDDGEDLILGRGIRKGPESHFSAFYNNNKDFHAENKDEP